MAGTLVKSGGSGPVGFQRHLGSSLYVGASGGPWGPPLPLPAPRLLAGPGPLLTSTTTPRAGKKLFNSFKKAAWIASTTMLVLMVPLIIEMDREQQILEMEKQQMDVLTGPGGAPKL